MHVRVWVVGVSGFERENDGVPLKKLGFDREKLVLVDSDRRNWFASIWTKKAGFGRFWQKKWFGSILTEKLDFDWENWFWSILDKKPRFDRKKTGFGRF